MNNWDSYKRKSANIKEAVDNAVVNELINKHYKYLHQKLVKCEEDEDIFNDTYLRLTYQYNSDADFISQFIKYFKLLKGAFYRDDNKFKYLFQNLDDNIEISDEPIKEERSSDSNFINNLKLAINAYNKQNSKEKNRNR